MATDLSALKAAIKLLADAGNGIVKAAESGQGVAGYLPIVSAILPDLLVALPLIGEIPSEVSALEAADYASLLSDLAADLNIANPKVEAIIAAVIPIISSLASQVPALIAAVKM